MPGSISGFRYILAAMAKLGYWQGMEGRKIFTSRS
jgi:hypothetical protein